MKTNCALALFKNIIQNFHEEKYNTNQTYFPNDDQELEILFFFYLQLNEKLIKSKNHSKTS